MHANFTGNLLLLMKIQSRSKLSISGNLQEKDEESGHFYNAIHRHYYDRYLSPTSKWIFLP